MKLTLPGSAATFPSSLSLSLLLITLSLPVSLAAETNYIVNGLDLQGPIFLHEPPHRVEFSNNSGGLIECSGHGSPPPEVSAEFFPKQFFLTVFQEFSSCFRLGVALPARLFFSLSLCLIMHAILVRAAFAYFQVN